MIGVYDTSIDLEDRERVLRVEAIPLLSNWDILQELDQVGFRCEEMPDRFEC
jgi:hypothetical protein